MFFRNNSKGCQKRTKMALESNSVSNRISEVDNPRGTEEDSVSYLRSHELQQNAIIENEHTSHMYEEIKEEQYGKLEQSFEDKQYLHITDEVTPYLKDPNLAIEVYLTPVTFGDQHVTGSKVMNDRAEYITPVS